MNIVRKKVNNNNALVFYGIGQREKFSKTAYEKTDFI